MFGSVWVALFSLVVTYFPLITRVWKGTSWVFMVFIHAREAFRKGRVYVSVVIRIAPREIRAIHAKK